MTGTSDTLGGEVKTGKKDGSVEFVVRCECGFETRGTEDELIPVVQRHGREVHNMDVTRDQVLAMARPA